MNFESIRSVLVCQCMQLVLTLSIVKPWLFISLVWIYIYYKNIYYILWKHFLISLKYLLSFLYGFITCLVSIFSHITADGWSIYHYFFLDPANTYYPLTLQKKWSWDCPGLNFYFFLQFYRVWHALDCTSARKKSFWKLDYDILMFMF